MSEEEAPKVAEKIKRKPRMAIVQPAAPPPPPPSKPVRKARPAPLDKEIRAALKRLNYAVDSTNIEMFKIAAYQVVQQKLSEVANLLRSVAPVASFQPASGPAVASSPAGRPMTLENIDAMVNRLDAAVTAPAPQAVRNPCQWCGRPGIRKNSRGMWVCQGHLALAIEDDGNARLRQRLQQGFGNDEEVIRVDAGTIARMSANEQE